MNRTDDISKLATALAVAQGQIESASKDATNPHFRSKYADFDSVRDAVKKPLSSNGIAFLQFPRIVEGGVEVETLLVHGESGQSVSEVLFVPLGQITPQAIGSAITYLRRYSLQTIVGVSAGEDDDGNAAEKVADRNFRPEPKPVAKKHSVQPSMQEKEAESSDVRDMMFAEIQMIRTKADAAKWALANEARKGFLFAEHYKQVSEAFKKKIVEFTKPAGQKQPEFIDFENLRSLVDTELRRATDVKAMRDVFQVITGPHWDTLLPPDREDLQRMLRNAEAAIQGADEDGVIWGEEEPT